MCVMCLWQKKICGKLNNKDKERKKEIFLRNFDTHRETKAKMSKNYHHHHKGIRFRKKFFLGKTL